MMMMANLKEPLFIKKNEGMKFNYIIYEISIKQSIIHTLKEISDVIGKPDLKYPTYRGQHKNGAINVEDISYMGSGSDLKVIRKYFCARDTTKYSIEDIFNFKILDQGITSLISFSIYTA